MSSSLVSRTKALLSDKENLIHLLLVGAIAALGARSVTQQGEIDALEAQKDSLLAANRQMQKSTWEWRQSLFALHHRDPSAISLPTLLDLFGGEKAEAEADLRLPPTDKQACVYSVPPLPYVKDEAKGTAIAAEEGTTNPTSRIGVEAFNRY